MTDSGDPAPEPEAGADDGQRDGTDRPVFAPPADDGFDWRGWALVAVVFVCFLVIPGAILLLPGAGEFLGSLGLSLRDAYLTLPLLPAILLGAVAVWSAVANRRS